MIRYAIVLICVLLLACGIPQPRLAPIFPTRAHFHVDTRMNETQRDDLLRAGRAWRDFTKGNVQFSFVFDLDETTLYALKDEPRITIIGQTDRRITDLDREGFNTLAYTIQSRPYRIGVCPDRLRSPLQFYPVMLHELGHVAKLKHSQTQGTAVMSFAAPTDAFTPEDLELCRDAGACQ